MENHPLIARPAGKQASHGGREACNLAGRARTLRRHFRRLLFSASIAAAAFSSTSAMAQALPPSAETILREAKPGGERDTVENVLKRLYPASRDQVDTIIDKIKDDEKKEVAETDIWHGWTGQGAIGASLSTGNTDEFSFTASLDVKRKGPQWEHRFESDIDIKNVDGERSKERVTGNYRARRDFKKSPWFLFGSFGYEHDNPQGISSRFTEAVGVGYQIVDSDDFDWEVTASPALRQTRFTNRTDESRLGLYVATDIDWDISNTLNFTQKVDAVMDEGTLSLGSDSSLTANIYGNLSARFSIGVNYESDPPLGKVKTDTSTRLSLVLNM